MFQDIKNIIKVHTDNLSSVIPTQKHEEESKSFSQDLRILKELISSKAESKFVKECNELASRLKSEVTDLSRTCVSMQSRLGSFDSILNKENTDFKVSLLERKISALEHRLARGSEEKCRNSNIVSTLYTIPSIPRPSTSKNNRSSLHSRNMSYQGS